MEVARFSKRGSLINDTPDNTTEEEHEHHSRIVIVSAVRIGIAIEADLTDIGDKRKCRSQRSAFVYGRLNDKVC